MCYICYSIIYIVNICLIKILLIMCKQTCVLTILYASYIHQYSPCTVHRINFANIYRYVWVHRYNYIRKNSVCIVSRVLTQHVQLIKYLCRAIEIRLAINNNKNHLLPPIVSLNIKRINLE